MSKMMVATQIARMAKGQRFAASASASECIVGLRLRMANKLIAGRQAAKLGPDQSEFRAANGDPILTRFDKQSTSRHLPPGELG